MINVGVIGATGSVGSSVMSVCEAWPDKITVKAVASNKRSEKLSRLAERFNVSKVYPYEETGQEGLEALALDPDIEHVVFASSGTAAIKALCSALKAGKTVSLANKESIVVAGKWVMPLVKHSDQLRPLDSEHNAIWQCLHGEGKEFVRKIYLTASGGPFRKFTADELRNVTPEMALRHPVWDMGAKITIDSASMMNKGFEVIEAKWLFGLQPEQIDVIVHPQSIVHSMVQYVDGAVKAQLGIPDMKLPIQYALTYPNRVHLSAPRLDFRKDSQLTFLEPDTKKFRNLTFAFEALRRKGNAACVLNAANEVVVNAFLHEKIGFLTMSDIIEKTMEKAAYIAEPTYEDYVQSDKEARRIAEEML